MTVKLLPPYWHWNSALQPSLLGLALMESGNQDSVEQGQIFVGSPHGVRNSTVILHHGTHWLAGVLANYAAHANESAGWKFSLSKPTTLQYAHYGPEQFYDWHTDNDILLDAPEVRKLSVVCLLNDPSEFEGGQLELQGVDVVPLTQGSIVVFPSLLRHRVTPVTSGIRKSATCWVDGPNVK